MTTVSFGTTVSLAEAATLVRVNTTKHYFLRGEPGIGKSSIMDAFEQHFGDAYNYVYFDCANKDLGDIAMPSIDRDKKITEYFLNGIFKHYNGKPMVIMLDEFTKAPQPIQNMLHPLLERRNPRLADWLAPEGTITFLTGNMASDGVGDSIKAHTLNRVTAVTVRKPTAEEWLAWAVNHDIDPVVMAWVNQFPHALESYLDGNQDSNPYIYNPKKMQGAYVSPRSLQLASDSLKNREHFTANAMLADMIGTIGEAGARDLHAFVEYQDQLPSWESIINSPKTARLPESPGACAVLVFGGIARIDSASITPFMDYVERMEPEWQAVFCINVVKNPSKAQVAYKSTKFRDWCTSNVDIL
jgi:hypothetical protein